MKKWIYWDKEAHGHHIGPMFIRFIRAPWLRMIGFRWQGRTLEIWLWKLGIDVVFWAHAEGCECHECLLF